MEIIVVLLISTLSFSIAFKSYDIAEKVSLNLRNKFTMQDSVLSMFRIIKADMDNAIGIFPTENGFYCSLTNNICKYEFSESVIIREVSGSHNDTIFRNYIVDYSILKSLENPDLIQSIRLYIPNGTDTIKYQIIKEYDFKTYIDYYESYKNR